MWRTSTFEYEAIWRVGKKFGATHEMFNLPRVAVDAQGDVYILDTGNNRIIKFNRDGKFVDSFGGAGQRSDQFLIPYAIQVGRDENIFTMEAGIRRIKILDRKLKLLHSFSVESGGGDIAVDSKNMLYVATSDEDQFLRSYNEKGQYVASLGQRLIHLGPKGEKLYSPYHFVADHEDNIHIAFLKSDTCIIDRYVLGKKSVYRTRLAISDIISDSSHGQKDFFLTSGQDGYLYLLFIPLNIIYRLSAKDDLLGKISISPIDLGSNAKIAFLAVDPESNLYVLDYSNRELLKLSPAKRK